MKKLLALVLCVMLFASVIPTAAFADTAAGSSSSAVTDAQIAAAIKAALAYKDDQMKKIAANYEANVKALVKDAFAYRNGVALNIVNNYKGLVDAIGATSEAAAQKEFDKVWKGVTEEYDKIQKSADEEVAKIVAAAWAAVS